MDALSPAIRAIAKLNELTQQGRLKWEVVSPPDTRGSSDVVEIAFGTEHEGKRLRIFSRRSKVEVDEKRFEWLKSPVLEVVDSDGKPLYEFPGLSWIDHLLESVGYQVAGVGRWMEKLASGG